MSDELQDPKYPNVSVQLSGTDGNAFSILGRVIRVMKDNGVSVHERDAFTREAMSGDYNHLLATCAKWVNVQ